MVKIMKTSTFWGDPSSASDKKMTTGLNPSSLRTNDYFWGRVTIDIRMELILRRPHLEQSRREVPEVIHEVLVQSPRGVACARDAHCLEDSAASQLLKHVGVVKHHRLVRRVGLDASHVVGLHAEQ